MVGCGRAIVVCVVFGCRFEFGYLVVTIKVGFVVLCLGFMCIVVGRLVMMIVVERFGWCCFG